MKITRYLLRRLVFVVPQFVGVTLITFLLVQLIPGDPARLMLGPLASEETIKLLRDHLGLNRSLPEQYVLYVWHALQFDLGTSWRSTNPVATDLRQRLPATLELITYSLVLAVAIAIPWESELRASPAVCATASPSATASWPARCPSSGSG